MKFVKKSKWLLLSAAILAIIVSLPEIYIYLRVDKKLLKSGIEKFIQEAKISITYDGYGFGAYNGLVLYEVNISGEADFNRGRSFLVAKELRLSFDWSHYFKTSEVKFSKLSVDEPTMEVWYENNSFNGTLFDQLRSWSQSKSIEVAIKNANLRWNAQLSAFRKRIYDIKKVSIEYDPSEKNSVQIQYNDDHLGKGKIKTSLFGCDPKKSFCGNWLGAIQYSFDNFPGIELGFWLSRWSFNQGEVSGELFFESKLKTEKVISRNLKVDAEFEDFDLLYMEDDFFREKNIQFTLDHQLELVNNTGADEELLNRIEAQAETRHHYLKLQMKKSQEIWPEDFSLEISPKKSAEKTLQLPYHITLKGLKKFYFSMSKPARIYYSPIRHFKADIEIAEGDLITPEFSLKNLNLRLSNPGQQENNFNWSASFDAQAAKIRIKDSFSVNSLVYPYAEILFSSFHGGSRVRVHDLVALPSKHTGELEIENLDIPTFDFYFKIIKENLSKELIIAMKKLWNEPRFREEPFFLRFLNNSDFNWLIKIKSWRYDHTHSLDLTGNLTAGSNSIQLQLNTPDSLTNKFIFQTQYNYMTSYPVFSLDADLELINSYELLKHFLPATGIKKFTNAKWKYKATAQASTLDHIAKSWAADFDISLDNPKVLHIELQKKEIKDFNASRMTMIGKNLGNIGWFYLWQEFSGPRDQEVLQVYGNGQWLDEWQNEQLKRSFSLNLTQLK